MRTQGDACRSFDKNANLIVNTMNLAAGHCPLRYLQARLEAVLKQSSAIVTVHGLSWTTGDHALQEAESCVVSLHYSTLPLLYPETQCKVCRRSQVIPNMTSYNYHQYLSCALLLFSRILLSSVFLYATEVHCCFGLPIASLANKDTAAE